MRTRARGPAFEAWELNWELDYDADFELHRGSQSCGELARELDWGRRPARGITC